VTTQLGRTTTYLADVDSMGVPQSTVIDPAGLRTVSWSSMAHGYTNLYAPDGTISSYAFAADPRFGAQAPAIDTAMVTTPFGLVTTFGMLKSVVLAQAGNALSLVSETETRTTNGLTSIRRYDAVAHTYTATSPEGRTRLDSLDGRGRLVLRRAPGLAAFLMSYDAKGRLASVRQGSRLLQYAYDARGNLASTTDPIGKVTSFSYDAADRVVSKQRPDSSVISFGYDLTGSVASITPPGRSPHTFTYSLNGEVTSYVPPSVGGLATPTTYSYDADHSLTRMIRGDGATIDFSYDAAGRAIRLTTPQGQYATTYDAAGKVRTTSTPGGSVETIDYDAQLPIQDAWTGPVWGYITFGLDDRHQLTSLVIDGIDSASFQYDRDGMLIAAGDLIVSRDAGNALVTGLTLGSLATGDRLDSLGAVQSESVSVAGAALFQRSYARDSAGRIALVTETVQGVVTTIGYAYDAAGRLAQVTRNGSVVSSYQYDANGNRVLAVGSSGSVVGTYDAQDRLAAYGTTSFTYTPNGELFQRITPVDTSTYSYDNFGNLTRVKIPGKQIDYILDAQGRRIGRKLNGAKVQGFLYVGPDAPVAQLDAFDNIVSVFIYARHLNVPDYMVKGGVEYQLITDQLGSVRLVVNATTGQVVQRIDYDEFGAITANTNPGFQPFGFAGGLYDDDSKLVHFRTREYDPRTGRWTTKDPILFGGGSANLYTYIDNDPVNAVDADGEMPIFLAVALIGGAIDAIAGAIEYWDCGGTVAAKHAGIQFAAGFLGAMAAEYLISKGRLDIAAKVGAAVEALVRDALEVMLTGEHVNAIKVAETVAEEVIENVVFTMGAERVSKWATPQRGRKPFRLAPRPRKDWTEGPIDDATRKATESVVKDEADWLKKFLKRCPVDCKL
jgi:RHS repeat-associated protein